MLELFKQAFTTYFIQTIVVGIFTLVATLGRQGLKYYKQSLALKRETLQKESEEQKRMKEGLLALLRFRINRLVTIIKVKGYMTSDESYDLQDLYKAYEALGGNSRTHMLYEDIMKRFKIRDE